MLNLTHCQNNAEVVELIQKQIKLFNLEDIIKNCNQDFIFHNDAVKALFCALAAGENIILWGPGGFGKSALVRHLLKLLEIPYLVKIGYEDMQPEELFGVPNMDKLLNNSEYEIAFEKSVFSKPGVLILEEFLDVAPSTGAALKDILSQKGFRDHSEFKPSLISSIIICTNKSPEDVSINDSLSAFYKDRFPIRYKMIWPSFTTDDYINFFKIYFKKTYYIQRDEFNILAHIFAFSVSKSGDILSPRVAAQAGNIMMTSGLKNINVIAGLSTIHLDELIQQKYKETQSELQERILAEAGRSIEKLEFNLQNYIKLYSYKVALQNVNFDDSYLFVVETINSKITQFMEEFHEKNLYDSNKSAITNFETLCLTMEE